MRPHGRQSPRPDARARGPPQRRAAPGRHHGRVDADRRAHRRRGGDVPLVHHRPARPRLHPRRDEAPGRDARRGRRGRARGGPRRRRGGRRVGRCRRAQDVPGPRPRARLGREARGLGGVPRDHAVARQDARRRDVARRHALLRLGRAPRAGGLLPRLAVHGVRDRARQGLRAALGPPLDGDGRARRPAGARVCAARPRGVPGAVARVQPLAVVQLGRWRPLRRRLADRGVHGRPRGGGLRLAVHHARGLPLQRLSHAQLRPRLRVARHARLRRDDPARGARHGRADPQAPDLVRRRAHGHDAGSRDGRRLVDRVHGRGRDGRPVRRGPGRRRGGRRRRRRRGAPAAALGLPPYEPHGRAQGRDQAPRPRRAEEREARARRRAPRRQVRAPRRVNTSTPSFRAGDGASPRFRKSLLNPPAAPVVPAPCPV
mmetsp:Transcript_838/g.2538  ORF Transcript_838/g.2538 Transcript_838/m.2538 type:complete len:430 (+) Transcript_838:829-2118(+)